MARPALPPRRLRPGDQQVFQHAQRRQQRELLEHHADAGAIASRGDANETSRPSMRCVRHPADRSRTTGSSACSCRRRSRRAAPAPRRGISRGRRRRWRRRRQSAFRPGHGDQREAVDVASGLMRMFRPACPPRQSIAKMASTSTAAPCGRLATPIAVRACRPRSPNSSWIRSDAPLMTCGTC